MSIENLTVEVNVVVVDGIVEGDSDHLRYILASRTSGTNLAQVAWYLCTILRTETVRKFANVAITWWCSVGVSVNV